jgi:hypothetical protein
MISKSEEWENRKPDLKESVNSPSHYNPGPHEVWKCLKDWGLEKDALLYQAVCYIARSDKKGSKKEDLQKAVWYINKRIESLW